MRARDQGSDQILRRVYGEAHRFCVRPLNWGQTISDSLSSVFSCHVLKRLENKRCDSGGIKTSKIHQRILNLSCTLSRLTNSWYFCFPRAKLCASLDAASSIEKQPASRILHDRTYSPLSKNFRRIFDSLPSYRVLFRIWTGSFSHHASRLHQRCFRKW